MGRISGITREQIEEITDAAMVKANGDRKIAAVELGIVIEAIHRRIARSPALRAKWGRPIERQSAPRDAVTLHRPVIDAKAERNLPVLRDDPEAIEKAMDAEDERVRTGIGRLGLTEAELKLAVAFQAFQKRMFSTSFEMLGGGITKQFVSLCVEIDEISKELKEGGLEPNMEAILREDRSRLLAIQVQMYDRANKAVLTQIEVKRMRDGDGGKKEKPGFKPLAMSVKGDVHIHEQRAS